MAEERHSKRKSDRSASHASAPVSRKDQLIELLCDAFFGADMRSEETKAAEEEDSRRIRQRHILAVAADQRLYRARAPLAHDPILGRESAPTPARDPVEYASSRSRVPEIARGASDARSTGKDRDPADYTPSRGRIPEIAREVLEYLPPRFELEFVTRPGELGFEEAAMPSVTLQCVDFPKYWTIEYEGPIQWRWFVDTPDQGMLTHDSLSEYTHVTLDAFIDAYGALGLPTFFFTRVTVHKPTGDRVVRSSGRFGWKTKNPVNNHIEAMSLWFDVRDPAAEIQFYECSAPFLYLMTRRDTREFRMLAKQLTRSEFPVPTQADCDLVAQQWVLFIQEWNRAVAAPRPVHVWRPEDL